MKKVLAGIAVLAVAAAAQAGLLSSWTISGGNLAVERGDGEGAGNITFATPTADGLGSVLTGTTWRLNNWAAGGESTGNKMGATFDLEDNYTFKLDSIVTTISAANPGAANFVWQNENGQAVTEVKGFTTSGSHDMTFAGQGANVWTADGGLYMVAADGKNSAGANASSGSRSDIRNKVEIYGTVSSVPEPATMSLLGLGALAIALRRKLRK